MDGVLNIIFLYSKFIKNFNFKILSFCIFKEDKKQIEKKTFEKKIRQIMFKL